MALTEIDPTPALVVIDLQKGVAALPTLHPADAVIRNAAALAAAFRRKALPVVLVTVAGVPPGRTEQPRRLSDLPAGWADLVPEMDAQPGDHRVTKRTWGAFTSTDLDAFLKSRGVTQVVIVGIATSFGVESTARFAHELGYNVVLAVDAMTDMTEEAHVGSVTRVFPRLGETAATAEILARLAPATGA